MLNARIVIYCVVAIISLFLFSCKKANNPKDKVSYYFDLKAYFDAEAAQLQLKNPQVQKNVVLNGVMESKTTGIDDWKNEFLTFSEADINKTAFAGKYIADTILMNGKINKITYTANDNNLKTRFLEILFDTTTNVPKHINLNIETENTLYYSAQSLHYTKNHSYAVSGNQKIKFLNPDEFKVEVKF